MSMFWAARSGMSASVDAVQAKGEARGATQKTRELDDRLDRALLACEAMWTILRDKLGVTDEQLISRINEIDLSDGKLDGKVRKQAVTCPKCRRTISPRFPQCMYCGQPIMHDPFA